MKTKPDKSTKLCQEISLIQSNLWKQIRSVEHNFLILELSEKKTLSQKVECNYAIKNISQINSVNFSFQNITLIILSIHSSISHLTTTEVLYLQCICSVLSKSIGLLLWLNTTYILLNMLKISLTLGHFEILGRNRRWLYFNLWLLSVSGKPANWKI